MNFNSEISEMLMRACMGSFEDYNEYDDFCEDYDDNGEFYFKLRKIYQTKYNQYLINIVRDKLLKTNPKTLELIS
jgi:hypothetical protein